MRTSGSYPLSSIGGLSYNQRRRWVDRANSTQGADTRRGVPGRGVCADDLRDDRAGAAFFAGRGMEEAAEAGVDLVELRIDCLRREPDLKRILKDRPTPLVFTIRRGVDGGLWRGNEDKRQQLLREADRPGGRLRRPRDGHRPQDPPVRQDQADRQLSQHEDHAGRHLQDIAEQCAEFDPDVVKIATSATTLAEASRVLHLGDNGQGADDPDRHGRDRRLHADPRRASSEPRSLTPASIPNGSSPPGCCHYGVLKNDFAYDEINANTEVYGVMGDPIEQSLSPVVHNAAFRHLGLNKVMVPFLVPNGELPAFFKELLWLDIKGCSVTIPHKEAIVPLLQQKEGAVERTGSCNTVRLPGGRAAGRL